MSAPVRIMTTGVMLLCVGLLAQGQAAAQDSSANFLISGTSTVRSWSCPARGTLTTSPGPSAAAVPGFPDGVQTMVVTVPVKAITCDEDEMNEHLRDVFKQKGDAEIVYRLGGYELTGTDLAKTTGTITIDGVTRPVAFDVKLVSSAEGVRGEGETTIDLTDFNIAPPTVWLGLLRVGKNIRVRFDAVLPPAN